MLRLTMAIKVPKTCMGSSTIKWLWFWITRKEIFIDQLEQDIPFLKLQLIGDKPSNTTLTPIILGAPLWGQRLDYNLEISQYLISLCPQESAAIGRLEMLQTSYKTFTCYYCLKIPLSKFKCLNGSEYFSGHWKPRSNPS